MTTRGHQTKKSSRHKKIMATVTQNASKQQVSQSEEQAIVKQFYRVKRGYSILMNEIIKEYDLVKNWIGTRTSNRAQDIKRKINEFIPLS